MNPLFNAMGGNAVPPMLQQLMQFKNSFSGNPQEQVQQMLDSGRISQQQLNQAMQQARQIMQTFNLK